MTVIFPHPDDQLVQPFVEPLGRMMLAYGRSMTALRELVIVKLGDEEKVVKFMGRLRSHELPTVILKEVGAIFREELRREELTSLCERLRDINFRRNRIVHGEWWFDLLRDDDTPLDRCLRIRDWDREDGIVHDETITPEVLREMAKEYSELSSDLDMLAGVAARDAASYGGE